MILAEIAFCADPLSALLMPSTLQKQAMIRASTSNRKNFLQPSTFLLTSVLTFLLFIKTLSENNVCQPTRQLSCADLAEYRLSNATCKGKVKMSYTGCPKHVPFFVWLKRKAVPSIVLFLYNLRWSVFNLEFKALF